NLVAFPHQTVALDNHLGLDLPFAFLLFRHQQRETLVEGLYMSLGSQLLPNHGNLLHHGSRRVLALADKCLARHTRKVLQESVRTLAQEHLNQRLARGLGWWGLR